MKLTPATPWPPSKSAETPSRRERVPAALTPGSMLRPLNLGSPLGPSPRRWPRQALSAHGPSASPSGQDDAGRSAVDDPMLDKAQPSVWGARSGAWSNGASDQGGDAPHDQAGDARWRSRFGIREATPARKGRSQAPDSDVLVWDALPNLEAAMALWLQRGLSRHAERIWRRAGALTPLDAQALPMQHRTQLRDAGLSLGLAPVRAALLAAELQLADKAPQGLSPALLPLLLLQLMRPSYPAKLAIHQAWSQVLARTPGLAQRSALHEL